MSLDTKHGLPALSLIPDEGVVAQFTAHNPILIGIDSIIERLDTWREFATKLRIALQRKERMPFFY